MSNVKLTLPNPKLPWPVPYSTVRTLALQEGCALEAYLCPAGVWTIFYGETHGVYPGMKGTQAEADMALLQSLRYYTVHVQAMCTVPTNINQLGALVSLAYNIGLGTKGKPGGLLNSSVLKAHNRGDTTAAAEAFTLYTKARDPKTKKLRSLPGLVRRRSIEAALYLQPDVAPAVPATADQPAVPVAAPAPVPMPQAVAAPTPVAAHPITLAGAASIATSALTALNDASTQAQAIGTTAQTTATNAQSAVASASSAASTAHDFVQTLAQFVGVTPGQLLAGVLAVAGAYAVYYMVRQRKAGLL